MMSQIKKRPFFKQPMLFFYHDMDQESVKRNLFKKENSFGSSTVQMSKFEKLIERSFFGSWLLKIVSFVEIDQFLSIFSCYSLKIERKLAK